MIYRVQLTDVTYPKGKSYNVKPIGVALFTDLSKPRDSDWLLAARTKLRKFASNFRCEEYNPRKKKWEIVCCGNC